MSLLRRLEALEKGFTSEPPIQLFMPDGRIEILPGDRDYLGDLGLMGRLRRQGARCGAPVSKRQFNRTRRWANA
jgi:hypothetical protein